MSNYIIEENKCRLTNYDRNLNVNEFDRLACAKCYENLKYVIDNFEPKYTMLDNGYLLDDYSNETFLDLNQIDHVNKLKENLGNEIFYKWNDCCNEAKKCCTNVMANTTLNKLYNFSNSCETVWDGWSCHKRTLVGQISKVVCPMHMSDGCNLKLNGKQYVEFQCNSDGWFKNGDNEWANYSQCLSYTTDVKKNLVYANILIHILSIIMLALALIVFSSYRKLNVNRIRLHKHLFVSLLFNSIMQMLWEIFYDLQLTTSQGPSQAFLSYCVPIYILLHYSKSTTYFWMFSESIYLHRYLTNVFMNEINLVCFYLIGWGFPFVLTVIFVSVNVWKHFDTEFSDQNCWLGHYSSIYIYMIPNIIILILNFIFLINIIRVIYKTLNFSREENQIRRTVKSALILVPLFGLHFLISPVVMCDATPGSEYYNLFNIFVENSNGMFVALVYCFLSKEIIKLMKSTLCKVFRRFRDTEISITSNTPNETDKFF